MAQFFQPWTGLGMHYDLITGGMYERLELSIQGLALALRQDSYQDGNIVDENVPRFTDKSSGSRLVLKETTRFSPI